MRKVFQDARYNVTITNFVCNAFEQIEALQPDALIVDLVVGQEAVWDFLQRLNAGAITTGIPVLLISTSSRLLEEAQEQAVHYGSYHSLVKPFDINDLLVCIQDMIGTA